MNTPNNPKWLALYAGLIWLIAPVIETIYYLIEYKRGSYPPESDSIMIPIMNFTIGWFITSPLFILALWLSLRNYPGKVSILAWNKNRIILSSLVTIVVIPWILYEIYYSALSISRVNLFDLLESILVAHILILLRATIVMKKKFNT